MRLERCSIALLLLIVLSQLLLCFPQSRKIKIVFIDEESGNPVNGVFVVKRGSKLTYVKTGSKGEITVDEGAIIYGPRVSKKPYFPVEIIAIKNATIKLKRAYFVILKRYLAVLDPVKSSRIVIPVGVVEFKINNMSFGHGSSVRYLGLNSSTGLAPLRGGLMSVKVKDFFINISLPSLDWGETYFLDLREVSLKYNELAFNKSISFIEKKISELEKDGIYLGFCKVYLEEVKKSLAEALQKKDIEDILLEYEKSYLLYTSIKERLSFFEEKSNEVVPLMSILIAVLSYLIASLFFDKSSKKLVFYSMLYYTLILSLFTVYPFLREGNPYFTVSPMFVYLFTLIPAVLSDKIPDYYTQEGFSLLSGATASLSMILRSARRRRLRTGLTLFTVALVAFSVHTLNLMTTMYWSFEKELKYSVSVKPNTVLVVKPKYGDYPYSPLSIVFIRLLSEIGHTEALCIKRESSPTLKEIRLEYRGRETYVSGVISYTKGVTKFIPLESIVMKGRLPEEGLEVMISNNIANLLSINVDKNITIGKYTAKVVGIFRGKSLDDLRDLDGMSITPTVVIREGGAKTVERLSGDSIIICSDELASLLKIPRYKVYIKPKENPFFYAEKVAFISDSCTYVFYKNTVKYYTVAPVIIVKGESLVVPLIIAILTVFVSIMENVYERRKEIEILSSLGLNPSHIAYLFSLEGIVLGYVGSGIGLLSGFIAFKLLNMSSVVIPVDFKLSIYEILFTVFLAVGVSLLAALPPALKASTLVTPSLERRWKLKETKEFMEEGITERLPVRIPLGKSRDFVDFILGRFRELSFGLTQKVEVMSIEELGDREYRISFKYYRGSDISYQACFTENTLEVYKVSEDTYGVKVTSRPVTQHSKLGLYYVHETLSFLRKIALEWSSRALRIVVALGENPSTLYTVIKHLDPYEVIVVTEARNLKTVEYVKKALMEEKRRTPAIKTYLISSLKDIEKVLSELSYYIRESQYTVISYDSGLAGVLLSIASSAVRKKILLLTDKRSLREKIAYPLKEAEISEISPLEIDKMLEKIKTE